MYLFAVKGFFADEKSLVNIVKYNEYKTLISINRYMVIELLLFIMIIKICILHLPL